MSWRPSITRSSGTPGSGAVKLSLRVLATNEPARRLYERAGFVVEGVLKNEFRIDGADVDDYLLARYLS